MPSLAPLRSASRADRELAAAAAEMEATARSMSDTAEDGAGRTLAGRGRRAADFRECADRRGSERGDGPPRSRRSSIRSPNPPAMAEPAWPMPAAPTPRCSSSPPPRPVGEVVQMILRDRAARPTCSPSNATIEAARPVGRAGLRRGRGGGEDPRRPDREGHRRDRRAGRPDPGGDAGRRRRHPAYRHGDRRHVGPVGGVAAAMEEQGSATREIARSVAHAAGAQRRSAPPSAACATAAPHRRAATRVLDAPAPSRPSRAAHAGGGRVPGGGEGGVREEGIALLPKTLFVFASVSDAKDGERLQATFVQSQPIPARGASAACPA